MQYAAEHIVYTGTDQIWYTYIKCTSEQVWFFAWYSNVKISEVIQEKHIFDHLYTYFKGP